jgi:hypothetical protein
MKTAFVFACFVFAGFLAFGQETGNYAETDRIALNIPDAQAHSTEDIAAYINKNFDTDDKKVRAAYIWVIFHIQYSKDSLHRVILDADKDQLVTVTMRRRKGVCEDFSSVFNDICRKVNLRSFVIQGYSKQSGSVDNSSHAWCTVFINNKWMLYDPTWDEAFVNNFSLPVSTRYYQVAPQVFIENHMPFDPMFQLSYHPVTYKEFNNGNINFDNGKAYFNYVDSINALQRLDPLTAYTNALLRIERNGTPDPLISTRLKQLKMEIEIINQDKDSAMYNGAIADYNSGIKVLNNFLAYRNNQFKPAKTNAEVDLIFNDINKYISSAHAKLNVLNNSQAVLMLNTGDVEAALDKLSARVKEEQIFLKNYIGAAKEK